MDLIEIDEDNVVLELTDSAVYFVNNISSDPYVIEVLTGPAGPAGPEGDSGASTWAEITDKPSTFTPSAHSHVIGDTTGLQAALDAKAADTDVVKLTGNQTIAGTKTFSSAPTVPADSFAIAATNGLQTALNGKAASVHTHAIADLTDFATEIRKTEALIFYSGGSYPLRNTVTTDSARRVRWVGPSAPTIGSGYAVDGLDVWELKA